MAIYKSKTPTKDGRAWFFKVPYTDAFGNTKDFVSKKFITKTEAKDEERKFLNKVKDERVVPIKMTLGDLWNDWMKRQEGITKISTKRNYQQSKLYFEKLFNIKCVDFNIQQFMAWKNDLEGMTNLKTVSKNDKLKVFRALLNYGRKTYDYNFGKILGTDSRFKEPNKVKEPHKVYSPDEFQMFLSGEEDLRFICLWEMLYFCGLRIGEARGLQWRDIDWATNTVWINKQVQSIDNYSASYFVTSLKTASSNRKLTMCESLVNHLKEYQKVVKKYTNYSDDFFLFGEDGGIVPVSYAKCRRRKKVMATKLGMKEIRLHDFRHSCASLLINSGAPITMVSKYMGHASVTETLNTYSHMFGSDFQSITNLIDNINKN